MTKAKKAGTHIWLKQKRSQIGKSEYQRVVLRGLGLKKIGQEVLLQDSPAIRGMIVKVQHMLDVQVREGAIEPMGARSKLKSISKGA
jgi:large subunit ribosomal protein L30